MIRYYYQKDPETLTDEEWSKHISEWQFIRKYEAEEQRSNFKQVLVELLNEILPGR